MDKNSTGSTITKKNIEDIFVVSRFTDITIQKNEIIDDIILEQPKEIIIEDKEEVKPRVEEKQLTMSDFFEEFKL